MKCFLRLDKYGCDWEHDCLSVSDKFSRLSEFEKMLSEISKMGEFDPLLAVIMCESGDGRRGWECHFKDAIDIYRHKVRRIRHENEFWIQIPQCRSYQEEKLCYATDKGSCKICPFYVNDNVKLWPEHEPGTYLDAKEGIDALEELKRTVKKWG